MDPIALLYSVFFALALSILVAVLGGIILLVFAFSPLAGIAVLAMTVVFTALDPMCLRR